MSLLVSRLAVIGVGLIGGSFARALKVAGCVGSIVGVGRASEHLKRAKMLGVVDEISTDPAQAVSEADVVFVAVPMGAYEGVFAAVGSRLKADAVVTDAGSTKQHAIEVARRHLPDLSRFVPGHPIAGTERSGVDASFADLFVGRRCILTPLPETDKEAISLVKRLWIACGSEVECMSAREHDELLAAVSHLPHVAAYALVNAVGACGRKGKDPFRYAAGGFRDFTRIASSSPEMWRDIVMTNRQAVMGCIDAFKAEIGRIEEALAAEDAQRLLELFGAAKEARDRWLAREGLA